MIYDGILIQIVTVSFKANQQFLSKSSMLTLLAFAFRNYVSPHMIWISPGNPFDDMLSVVNMPSLSIQSYIAFSTYSMCFQRRVTFRPRILDRFAPTYAIL